MKKKTTRKTAAATAPRIRYRIVTTAPSASLIALYKAAGWWHESAHDRRILPKTVKNSFAFAVATNDDGEIIGTGRVISDGCSDGYIQDVTVLPAYRGYGIGRGLIDLLAKHCIKKKLVWVGLVAEPGTYPFYRKLGFKDKKGFQLMLYAS